MSGQVKRVLLVILNFCFLGSGLAVSGRLWSGIICMLITCLLFFIGGISHIFDAFSGMILVYGLILFVYLWAFVLIYKEKKYDFVFWKRNLIIYLAFFVVGKLFFIMPIKLYYYDPLYVVGDIDHNVKAGDYVMTDLKRRFASEYVVIRNPAGKLYLDLNDGLNNEREKMGYGDYSIPLYIFWSKDLSRIGRVLHQ